jgi:uncharacterized protein
MESASRPNTLADWERLFASKIRAAADEDAARSGGFDPAHDHAHFLRVVATAKHLAEIEKARLEVVVPAAWLHDLVNVPKNDPRRSQASRLSGEEATKFLREHGYPEEYLPAIRNAIEAHSFSAKIEPTSLEAEIVQDADRLDGLGAVGIARVFLVGGLLRRRIYEPEDPFAASGRALDDLEYTVDHFFVKLFKTALTLRTAAGREEGRRRVEFMRGYLRELGREIGREFVEPSTR